MSDQLELAGWKLSFNSLSEFPNLVSDIRLKYQSVIKYIRKNEELINVLNLKLPTADLPKVTKLHILNVLYKKLLDDKEDRIAKLRELKIFRNAAGAICPLKSLVKQTDIGWLSLCKIHSEDYDPVLDDYLINKSVDIYNYVIVDHWNYLAPGLTNSNSISSLFGYASGVYKQNSNLRNLNDKKIVRINDIFVNTSDQFFYSSGLMVLDEGEYQHLQSAFLKINSPLLPNYDLLKFYSDTPFKLETSTFSYSIESPVALSKDEAQSLLKFCKKDGIELLKSCFLYQQEDEIIVAPKTDGVHLIFTDNEDVQVFIKKYYYDSFLVFPTSFSEFSSMLKLTGTALLTRLCHDLDLNNEKQLGEMIEIALQSDSDVRKYLLSRFDKLILNYQKDLTLIVLMLN
jgi:hypothetical protein